MNKKLNSFAFFLSLICLGLYLLAAMWQVPANIFETIVGTDLLNIVFFLSWITLMLGLIGIISPKKDYSFVKGFTTILIAFCITGILTTMILLNESFF